MYGIRNYAIISLCENTVQRSSILQVQVNVKRFGKRRNAIETRPYEIGAVHSIGGLIAAFVTAEVTRFNQRAAAGETALAYLTSEEIADAATVGKVGFGADYNGKVQDLAAIANAHQCFTDGIYRIFVNGAEVEGALDSPVTLHENDEITFVRLTMLAGRMW